MARTVAEVHDAPLAGIRERLARIETRLDHHRRAFALMRMLQIIILARLATPRE